MSEYLFLSRPDRLRRGVSYKKENVVSGALREFHEETLGSFPALKMENVEPCPVLYDDNNLVIFVRTDLNREDISAAFADRLSNFPTQKSWR